MPAGTNAEIRSRLMAKYEKRLREAFPDEGPPRAGAFADFNEIEAAGVRVGDATAAEFMEEAIDRSLDLSEFDLPKRCPKCGRALKHIRVPRSIATIRGLVGLRRIHCYCKRCKEGFFPLADGLAPA
jgi:hypothetical protein